MSGFGLKFGYFHKISFCKDLDIKTNGLTDEVSDLRRSGILIKIGRSVSGGNAYDINYDLIDPEQLIITKQEYLENHYKKSVLVEQKRLDQQSKILEEKFAQERLAEQKAYFAKQERERVKAEKENEKKLKFCDDQKVKAFRIYDSYCDWVFDNCGSNDSKFFDRSTASLKDIFDSIVLLAGAHLSVWFDEYGVPSYEGHTENEGHEYYKFVLEFVRLCTEFELIDDCIQEKTFHLYKHIKHPISEELANYWNFNLDRDQDKKFPLDSIRIFFYTCIIGGNWNFVHCQKIYNQKEKELQEELKVKEQDAVLEATNVYSFANYKKKIS